MNLPNDIELADPSFNANGPIDIILGAEIFWSLLGTERIKMANTDLYLFETLLGWVVGGVVPNLLNRNEHYSCNNIVTKNKYHDMHELMERFWALENIGDIPNKTWSEEDFVCEQQFLNTYRRDKTDGRFIIKLPFKNENVNLGDSRVTALRRFLA